MPTCPKCDLSHPDGTVFCPSCGTTLAPAQEELGLAATGLGMEVAATAIGPAAIRDTAQDGEPEKEGGTKETPEKEVEKPRRTGDDKDALVGEVVGGVYKVVERIGVGGMGVVYKVRHANLEKEFALKVLGQVAADHPDAVERFKQEARSASHIEHDNIVDIITLDSTEDEHLYIVMELLKGQSLASALREGPMEPARALHIAYQICSALHAAHEAGIIHRDLKPENVYLTKKGEHEFVKILDFGISKIHDAETERVRITKTGHVLGTPLYMSPEQAKGVSQLDRRVDVYSLGVILYEMLSGEPPFRGDNYFQLIWKHSNEAPEEIRGDVPEALKSVVMKALEKEPRNRHGSMLELEEALAEAVPDVPPPSFLMEHRPTSASAIAPAARLSEPPSPPRRTGLLVGAGAVLIALVAIGLGMAIRANGHDDGDRATVTPPPPVADASPANDAAKAVEAGSADASPRQPTSVRVTVKTDPAGAEVFLGAERLGVTPLVDLERETSTAELELRIVKRGFVTVRQSVTLTEDITVDVGLRRLGRDPGPDKVGPTPFKTDF